MEEKSISELGLTAFMPTLPSSAISRGICLSILCSSAKPVRIPASACKIVATVGFVAALKAHSLPYRIICSPWSGVLLTTTADLRPRYSMLATSGQKWRIVVRTAHVTHRRLPYKLEAGGAFFRKKGRSSSRITRISAEVLRPGFYRNKLGRKSHVVHTRLRSMIRKEVLLLRKTDDSRIDLQEYTGESLRRRWLL
jgi:hypothetical protein